MAGKKTSESFSAGGIGESQPFIAPEGTFEPGQIDWATLTVNGQAIPEHLWGLLPYTLTDQGRAEANEGKQEPRVQILRDEVDHSIAHYRDDLVDNLPFEEVHDPLKLAMKAHTPKGHRGLFMSEKKCDQDGMRRGVLDYQPVLDEKGQRVKVGGMFLASVPEERAQAAERYYQRKSQEAQQTAADKVREQSDQIISETKLRGLNRRKTGGLEFDGLQAEDGEMVVGEIGKEF